VERTEPGEEVELHRVEHDRGADLLREGAVVLGRQARLVALVVIGHPPIILEAVGLASHLRRRAVVGHLPGRDLGIELVEQIFVRRDLRSALSVVGTFGADGCAEKRRSGLVWG
jgi:hypothetical protein